ncbi:MAG: hypothetical protein JF606_29960, partial [Burkholderiales bacterium]|nr:hypothetical protein [Burkholderiales bacterium]
MNTPGLNVLRGMLAAAAVCVASSCAMVTGEPASAALTDAQIAAIVNSPDRTAADRENDRRRKPEQILGFIGLRPGMVALDVVAGGGYTTELLARGIGPTGKVFGQAQPRDPNRAVPAGARPPGAGVLDREARLAAANVAAAPIALVLQRLVDPVPPELAQGKLDLVTLMFNYHDLGFLGEGRAQMNRA